jgi:hypothetical protein
MGGKLFVFSSAAEGRDDEYNDWYTNVHLGEVLALGPFTAAQRFRLSEHQMFPQQHGYVAVYEFEGTAAEAAQALHDGSATLRMTDAIVDPHVMFVEDVTPRVTRD